MSENTEVQQESTLPPAKSDAEEALRQAGETGAEEVKADEAKPEAKEAKPNRTGDYIRRLQSEVSELRQYKAEQLAKSQNSAQPQRTASGPSDGEPTLADFDYNLEDYQRAHSRWTYQELSKQDRAQAEAATAHKAQHDALTAYQERALAFEAEHPDYLEAVDTFFSTYQPSQQVQMAVIRHDRGPEIAYYIANNDDEAWTIANTLPQNADAAIARLVKRMDATQQAPNPPAPPVRAISQAPAPAPRVGGRSVAVVPPEKQTDDDWYKADVERRRKR